MPDQMQADVTRPEHPCIMPNLKQFAKEGVTFTNAFCPTAHCCPARATFMTGLYPSRHGIYNNVSTPTAIHHGLNNNVKTFSEIMKNNGYKMSYTGKWHVSALENPSDRGWKELAITSSKESLNMNTIEKWKKEAQSAEKTGKRKRGEIIRQGWGSWQTYSSYKDTGLSGYEGTSDYNILQSGISELKKLAKDSTPWCLFIGVHAPHDEYEVPEKFINLYNTKNIPLPKSFKDKLEDKPRIYKRIRKIWDQLTIGETKEAIAHYWAYCTMVDDMFGKVIKTLDSTGVSENTVVLFLSDHGDYCGSHGLFCKGVPAFREAYNIPCIARYPKGIVKQGRTVNEFITLADFMPTFLEFAGIKTKIQFSGKSIMPFLKNRKVKNWRKTCFTQFNGVEMYYTQRVTITNNYKYVYNGFDEDELYDLKKDPFEMTNIINNPLYKNMLSDLVKKMWLFAAKEKDENIFNDYITVALAPQGPKNALRNQKVKIQ